MKGMKTKNKKISAGMAAVLAAGMLFAGQVVVYAGEGIDMSTSYPGITVKAGENVSFDLDFVSLTGESCDAALSIAEIPEGWEGYFRGSGSQITRVHINDDVEEATEATFSLTLPDEAEEGTYQVKLKADAGNGNSDTLELEIVVDETETGQSSNVASVSVEPGSSQGLTVSVTPPETIKEGEYSIPCTAVSASDTLSTELNVIITGSYEVELTTPSGKLSFDAYSNTEKAVTLTVKNNGNVDLENLNLSSSAPSNWEVRFDESTIDKLEAGASKEITAYVKPDSDAMTGDYVTSLTVKNDQTTSKAEFRVSVKTRTTWGIVAIVIILVLLAGLQYIFKKYGRR